MPFNSRERRARPSRVAENYRNGWPEPIGTDGRKLSESPRCLIHRCRNILAKVPKSAQAEVKAAFWKLFDDVKSEQLSPNQWCTSPGAESGSTKNDVHRVNLKMQF